MHKKFHFSIWYYVAIFGAIVLLEATVFSGNAVKEIPYSEFKNDLAANRVQSVVIQSSMIYGVLKPTQAEGATVALPATASGKKAEAGASASPGASHSSRRGRSVRICSSGSSAW